MYEIKSEHTEKGGIGAFFYGLIPGALGGAAILWLSFVSGCLDLQQQRTFAARMDNRVGVAEKLKDPVVLKIKRPNSCVIVDRAFIDGDTITAYIKHVCDDHHIGTPNYMMWHVEGRAPDSTIIQQWKTNYTDLPPSIGDVVEVSHEMEEDDRVATVVVWSGRE